MGGVQPNVIIKYESVREGAVHFFLESIVLIYLNYAHMCSYVYI